MTETFTIYYSGVLVKVEYFYFDICGCGSGLKQYSSSLWYCLSKTAVSDSNLATIYPTSRYSHTDDLPVLFKLFLSIASLFQNLIGQVQLSQVGVAFSF